MGRILQSFWPGISTATEVASLTVKGAPGGHLCVVCRTSSGALFGYETDSVDGGEPTSEAIVRFFTVSDAVAWMKRHGFPRESIEAAFLDPPPGVAPRREGNGAARPSHLNGSRG